MSWRKKLCVWFVLLMVSTLVIGTAGALGSSHYQLEDQRTWEWVGPGYQTNGGFVGAVQSNLWANNLNHQVGTVDGVYGPNTSQGIRTFQGWHGEQQDGIVGSATYSLFQEDHDMMTLSRYQYYPGSSAYHVEYARYEDEHGAVHVAYELINRNTSQIIATDFMWGSIHTR